MIDLFRKVVAQCTKFGNKLQHQFSRILAGLERWKTGSVIRNFITPNLESVRFHIKRQGFLPANNASDMLIHCLLLSAKNKNKCYQCDRIVYLVRCPICPVLCENMPPRFPTSFCPNRASELTWHGQHQLPMNLADLFETDEVFPTRQVPQKFSPSD